MLASPGTIMSTLHELAAMPSLPTLIVRVPGHVEATYLLQHGTTIGRAQSNSIVINHCDVCPQHARISRDATRHNGLSIICQRDFLLTLPSGNDIDEIPLEAGVAFWIGDVKCEFENFSAQLRIDQSASEPSHTRAEAIPVLPILPATRMT